MAERIHVIQYTCGVSLGDNNGGAELFAVRLAQSLDPARFRVGIGAMWWYGSPSERRWQRTLADQGIEVFFGGPYRPHIYQGMAGAFVGSLGQLRRLRPHIINTHVEFADTLGDAYRLLGIAPILVRTGHNVLEWTFSRLAAPIMHSIHPLVCTAEVGVSRAIVQQLDRRPVARLLQRRALYIHNGVDNDVVLGQRTGQNMRATLGIAPDIPLFGVVARLAEQKGLSFLIRAMPLVRAELPGARLVIAGDGEQAEDLRALVEHHDLSDCVSLLGARSDAVDLIDSLDVFVLPSLWEGLPTVVMEAMLVDTPVVATDVAGTRDLVLDGQTGLLAPPRDPEALAAAMLRQYRDRASARAMAQRARAHVEEFSIRRAAQRYTALYTRLYERRNIRNT
ncbi:MAG TPA: glycosyltransferase family 4 protein [Roseiflexaceae bacterium]|nr:glycosyltransferase family 4 protein [Roseiflexaceae bacterium]